MARAAAARALSVGGPPLVLKLRDGAAPPILTEGDERSLATELRAAGGGDGAAPSPPSRARCARWDGLAAEAVATLHAAGADAPAPDAPLLALLLERGDFASLAASPYWRRLLPAAAAAEPLLPPRVVGALGAAAMYAEAGAVLLARSHVHPALRSTSAKLCVLRRYLDGVAAEAGSELAGVQATVAEVVARSKIIRRLSDFTCTW